MVQGYMAGAGFDLVPIPFPSGTAPGAHPQESGGRLINAFSEQLSGVAEAKGVIRRVPGLKPWGTTTRSGFRGAIEINNILYSAWNGKLEKHTSSGGASVSIGNLTGTKRGFFARNNAATPDQVFVDADNNVATFTSSTVTNSYPDGDLPAPNSVTSIDGYLVFSIGDGRCFATNLNSTAVNPLSFGKAEFKPDGLLRALTYIDKLVLMGNYTTEIWVDQGLTPFPFARATTIPRGLAGPFAVAGYEDQFSKNLIWVAEDNTVVQLDGYTQSKISVPDLDRLIEAVTDRSTLEATAYMAAGHAFFELSCPSWTWVYDLNTKQWHERVSYGFTRSRIGQAVSAFNKAWYVGDRNSGDILQVDTKTFVERTSPLVTRIESGPVRSFPNKRRIARADFDFSVGVGQATGTDPIQTDPTVEISCSLDGGRSWGIPRQRKLGRQSIGKQRVTLRNLGQAGPYGPRFRLDISDPVYIGFMGGTISNNVRVG